MKRINRASRKRFATEALHIILNVALAVAVFALIQVGGRIEAALALVLISKWRIFAVRPRFWKANLQSNIVDITVSVGIVILMHMASTATDMTLWLQVGLAVLYALWLIVIKPRSSQRWATVQATTGLFIGVWVLAAVAHTMPLWLVTILYYIVGYGAARHILSSYEEKQLSLLSMAFGLLVAEIGWVASHWTVAYGVSQMADIKIPQLAIVVVLGGLVAYRAYVAYAQKKALRSPDVVIPAVFAVALIVILFAFFTTVGRGII